ncbi:MAG: molybdopterin dinucleotide binding domain protein [Planctomycetes bacterium ADurb.Bin126]|nr:MAG: molybdopterin dinucleotide binding domain protein [Planctomycetes bacterium ADurb.Bin126]
MSSSAATAEAAGLCTLCPGACAMQLARHGDFMLRGEVPLTNRGGLCPRGSALGEVLDPPSAARRILVPQARDDGRSVLLSFPDAVERVIQATAGGEITVFLDGNLPAEQLQAAAAWTAAWRNADLCLMIEPAERDLLIGLESSGAPYLEPSAWAGCDGFLLIGGVFEANPTCSRRIFERRKSDRKVPLVVIDPGGGAACKFASHRAACPPGRELAVLSAVALTAKAAGAALKSCSRLAVVVTAEYGRSADWAAIGCLAGRLAKARGGSVAPQTSGANALAAVRIEHRLGTLPLAKALLRNGDVRVVLGGDLAALLGWTQEQGTRGLAAAAAALPNRTTQAARIVLPMPLPAELSGTYLLEGSRAVTVGALVPPPAAVPTPEELLGAFARRGGTAAPRPPADVSGLLDRCDCPLPAAWPIPPGDAEPPGDEDLTLLLARQGFNAGTGEITAHASYQTIARAEPDVRLAPADAHRLGLRNLQPVLVRSRHGQFRGRAKLCPTLAAGAVVLDEALCEARRLLPCRLAPGGEGLVALPVPVTVEVLP